MDWLQEEDRGPCCSRYGSCLKGEPKVKKAIEPVEKIDERGDLENC